jgi:hypothetical protein
MFIRIKVKITINKLNTNYHLAPEKKIQKNFKIINFKLSLKWFGVTESDFNLHIRIQQGILHKKQ